MPRGPRGEKRPEDPAQAAVRSVRIAIGEITESLDANPTGEVRFERKPKDPAAVALGRLGGQRGGRARAERLTEVERKEIARKAATARWKNDC
jgi:hypothetical protein